MLKIIGILILVAFAGVAVFGFGLLGHFSHDNNSMGGGWCVSNLIHGSVCPNEQNPFIFADFHLGAYKGFLSLQVVKDKLAAAALIVFAIAIAAFALWRRALTELALNIGQIFRFSERPLAFEKRKAFLNWQALLVNSPNN